jgi:6-phosphogluconolactonase (cycloisomerase 2 family)
MRNSIQFAFAGIAFTAAALAQNSTQTGAVFIMNNSPVHNEVIEYKRSSDGSLQQLRAFPTGGRGSGGVTDPLESQGSLILSSDHSMLFAANAGSGDISVFHIFPFFGLSLVGIAPSGGSSPVALAQWGNLLYVLNSSGASNVSGFQIDGFGLLRPIPNSTRFLTTNTSGAASIAFSPDGKFLAVTERLTNSIDTFTVQSDGTLSPIVTTASAAPGVFAVLFAQDDIAVAVATGPAGAQNGSLLSTYSIGSGAQLTPVTAAAPTLGAASCWSAATPNGQFIYTANAGTSTISGFTLSANGTLTALPGTIVAMNPAGSTNLDIAVTADGKYLYSLNSGTGVIGIFAIQDDGTLKSAGTATGVTAAGGFNGIAAY